jgi:superfamily II DNA or RNA helicase
MEQNMFGMIIVDECHKTSTNPQSIQMFRTCIEYFASTYRIGLTATLHRADGLAECIKKIIGDIIYKIEKKDNDYACIYENRILLKFPIDSFQVPAQIKILYSDYDVMSKDVFSADGGTLVYAKLITSLAEDKSRNDLIIKTLKDINGSTIVLSDRVEQLKYLCANVENGVQIDGSTPKKEREKALKDVDSGKKKFLFASYALAKEGLNLPILSNLVMASPVKDFAIVSQSIGRIQRPYQGKTIATVYDIIDDTLNREMKKVILAGRGKRLSLEHLLEPIVKFFTENQNVAVHLFKSSKKDEVCLYIEKAIRNAIDHYVGDIPGNEKINAFDRDIIVDFYSFAVMGLFNQWITTGMRGNPNERMMRAGVLFENSMKRAVEKGSL